MDNNLIDNILNGLYDDSILNNPYIIYNNTLNNLLFNMNEEYYNLANRYYDSIIYMNENNIYYYNKTNNSILSSIYNKIIKVLNNYTNNYIKKLQDIFKEYMDNIISDNKNSNIQDILNKIYNNDIMINNRIMVKNIYNTNYFNIFNTNYPNNKMITKFIYTLYDDIYKNTYINIDKLNKIISKRSDYNNICRDILIGNSNIELSNITYDKFTIDNMSIVYSYNEYKNMNAINTIIDYKYFNKLYNRYPNYIKCYKDTMLQGVNTQNVFNTLIVRVNKNADRLYNNINTKKDIKNEYYKFLEKELRILKNYYYLWTIAYTGKLQAYISSYIQDSNLIKELSGIIL